MLSLSLVVQDQMLQYCLRGRSRQTVCGLDDKGLSTLPGVEVYQEGDVIVIPGGDAISQDNLNCTSEEVTEYPEVHVQPPQPVFVMVSV